MNDTVKCPKHTTGGGPCYCPAAGKSAVQRFVMRKIDFYYSDRWRRVINIYRCSKFGKEESDFTATKPEIERDHVCA